MSLSDADVPSQTPAWTWNNDGWREAPKAWRNFNKLWWGQSDKDVGEFLPIPNDLRTLMHLRHLPFAILVRESYVKMFKSVSRYARRNPGSGLLITGQPGSGECSYRDYAVNIRLTLSWRG